MASMPLPPRARKRLGKNIADAREALGHPASKRSRVAASIDSTRESLAQVERGQRGASVEWLKRLADALGTTVARLLNGVRLTPAKKR